MAYALLPVFYYHDHFMEMLGAVESVYGSLLNDAHRGFISAFRDLTKAQQCLYIRMANRKGFIFRRSSLHYAEISDDALQGLLDKGFIRLSSADDYDAILSTMNKTDLITMAVDENFQGWRKSWTKPALAAHIAGLLPYKEFSDKSAAGDFIVQEFCDIVDFLIFLYFGKTYDDLKSFTLRDLKIIQVADDVSLKARFSDAEEANICFFYHSLLKKLESGQPQAFERAAKILQETASTASEYSEMLKAKAVYKVGQFLERQKDYQLAIIIYKLSNSHACNERQVRLLYARGSKDEVRIILEKMIEDPASDDEYIFAADFYARKFRGEKSGSCLSLLRNAESINIDDIHRSSPEAGALSYFGRRQWKTYRTENSFWHVLFGLLFWDELYAGGATLHSGFDRVPHCLKDKNFAVIFADKISTKLDAIRAGAGMKIILATIASSWEKPNGIFSWSAVNIDAVRDFFSCADPHAIARIVALICSDFQGMRDGFPDLLLSNGNSLKFVEIKAEGDLIRRNQMARLRQLHEAGFEAEICRVAYSYDPEQVYVVVDVETTGGRSATDRITEIGAVKIRNHDILEEWHSLINPQRRIPKFISALTGITDDMVRLAPVFADIAGSFNAFMGDAVFVAHNVNFDYGFIAEEYRRLDMLFHYPKFCTVANMRRHYPGQDSYSLGSLCERFGLPLETHHRALCDAKAAAQLLSLINHKRAQ